MSFASSLDSPWPHCGWTKLQMGTLRVLINILCAFINKEKMTLQFSFLLFSVPVATILGESEIYLDAGSTINITCVVKHTPVPPSNVQWEHQGKV